MTGIKHYFSFSTGDFIDRKKGKGLELINEIGGQSVSLPLHLLEDSTVV
jgi:hypothetical protein